MHFGLSKYTASPKKNWQKGFFQNTSNEESFKKETKLGVLVKIIVDKGQNSKDFLQKAFSGVQKSNKNYL